MRKWVWSWHLVSIRSTLMASFITLAMLKTFNEFTIQQNTSAVKTVPQSFSAQHMHIFKHLQQSNGQTWNKSNRIVCAGYSCIWENCKLTALYGDISDGPGVGTLPICTDFTLAKPPLSCIITYKQYCAKVFEEAYIHGRSVVSSPRCLEKSISRIPSKTVCKCI